MRLLLIEDDIALAEPLAQSLARAGFAVDVLSDGLEAQPAPVFTDYDAIVLDLGLPGCPGLELLRQWRAQGVTTPVLILTARNAWHERVDGLKAGADDYLGKPFHTEELLARLQALLRRAAGQARECLSVAGLTLDEDRQEVRLTNGEAVALTGMEFRLLRYLMCHPGKVLGKEALTDHLYDQHNERGSNLIEVYVRRLREKIGAGYIRTQRGQGYRFGALDNPLIKPAVNPPVNPTE
ncbi:response regulator [Thiorhodovibrio frisius]|uniref:Response regulator with CheY-like receiver domain and winged-helix DNA-binding domain n=1 Tax=Thiorhodovibrio frisius TaxID=631362 RepID=H8Z380_9GAMM|nr:response regulator transcription factor [Thiorhodovibrio frisius]EIC21788.1 response regulator with CheY-like receiver domain and winged-helix DNA-binding domain [Thiorhodovibrio frisius]WPL21755.1 Transcriptional regulatory protein QseB [Thiorhodovibrio frisius]